MKKESQEIRVDPDPEALQGLKDQKEILELQVSRAHLGSKVQEASKENPVILESMGRKVTVVYRVILDLLGNLDFKDHLESLEWQDHLESKEMPDSLVSREILDLLGLLVCRALQETKDHQDPRGHLA